MPFLCATQAYGEHGSKDNVQGMTAQMHPQLLHQQNFSPARLPGAAGLRRSGAAGRGHSCGRSEKRWQCKDSGERIQPGLEAAHLLAQPGDTQLPRPSSEGQIPPLQRSSPGPLSRTWPARKRLVLANKTQCPGQKQSKREPGKAAF
ncbi:hypothetical protein VULLAG_LOCUS14949 [Vulpes lagopus]